MTTTKPATPRPPAQPGPAGSRRRRQAAGARQELNGAPGAWTDPDAPTGPVSAALGLLLGALELFGALFSWTGSSDG